MQEQTVQDTGTALGYTVANQLYRQTKPVNLVDPRGGQAQPTDTQNTGTPAQDTSATAPVEIQKELESLQKRLNDRTSFYDKRLAEMSEHTKSLVEKLAEVEAENKALKTAKKPLPASDDELREFAELHPDWARIIEAKAMQVAQTELEIAKEKAEKREKQLQDIKAKEAKDKLRQLHPDFETLEHDAQFKQWYSQQPKGVQNLIVSSDIYECSRGLDLYKKEMGIKTKKEKDLDASMSVNVSAPAVNTEENKPKVWTTSEIKKLNPRQYEKVAEEIAKALREGRVVQG